MFPPFTHPPMINTFKSADLQTTPSATRGLAERHENPVESTPPRWKRPLDLSCIVAALPLILPLVLLMILWIKLVSRGPALFLQERVGKDGIPFTLYKFRSMKVDAETASHEAYLRQLAESDSPMIKLDLLCDSRMIPGGCMMRASGLDELPQLLNVIKGQMSLVGPRPCLPHEYSLFNNEQKERFKILPGLTGCWQVSGKNRTTFNEMSLMDIGYAKSPSIITDLRIMMRTPSVLLTQFVHAAKHSCHVAFIDLRQSKPGDSCPTL